MISNFEDLERPLMDDSTTTRTDDNCDDEHTTNAAKKHHENEKLLIDDDLQCMDGNAEAYPTSCCCMLPSTQNFGCKEIFCFGSCSFFFLGISSMFLSMVAYAALYTAHPLIISMYPLFVCPFMLSKALYNIEGDQEEESPSSSSSSSYQQNCKICVVWVLMHGFPLIQSQKKFNFMILLTLVGILLWSFIDKHHQQRRRQQQQQKKTKKKNCPCSMITLVCLSWVSFLMWFEYAAAEELYSLMVGCDQFIFSIATCFSMKVGLFVYSTCQQKGGIGNMFGEAEYYQMLEKHRERDEEENEHAIRRQHLAFVGKAVRTGEGGREEETQATIATPDGYIAPKQVVVDSSTDRNTGEFTRRHNRS